MPRLTFTLPVVALVALAGCEVNDTPVNSRPSMADARDRGHVQSAVIDGMKDPAAAQLRNLRSYDLSNGQGRAICGEVNGKNSFGAYVGFTPFYLRIRDGVVVSRWTGDDEYGAAFAAESCAQAASGKMMVRG